MGAPVIDINIVKGKTFEFMYRYAESELSYARITGIPSTAPVRITSPLHGIPDGWPVRIEGLRAPVELNTSEDEYVFATRVSDSVIELNGVRADEYRPYTTGGNVVFSKPFDLTGCSARMQIRTAVNGDLLMSLNSDPLTERDGEITVDVELAGLSIHIAPEVTAAIAWQRGVYDLELITPDGGVYPITAISAVTVGAEITR